MCHVRSSASYTNCHQSAGPQQSYTPIRIATRERLEPSGAAAPNQRNKYELLHHTLLHLLHSAHVRDHIYLTRWRLCNFFSMSKPVFVNTNTSCVQNFATLWPWHDHFRHTGAYGRLILAHVLTKPMGLHRFDCFESYLVAGRFEHSKESSGPMKSASSKNPTPMWPSPLQVPTSTCHPTNRQFKVLFHPVLPDYRKSVAFCKVPRLRPFFLPVKAVC